jgi:hypothetical protein
VIRPHDVCDPARGGAEGGRTSAPRPGSVNVIAVLLADYLWSFSAAVAEIPRFQISRTKLTAVL